jgi:hypothetical protein
VNNKGGRENNENNENNKRIGVESPPRLQNNETAKTSGSSSPIRAVAASQARHGPTTTR